MSDYYPKGPALLYVTPTDPAEVHVLDSPMWTPDRLNYVERAALAARLRAIANVIDPGEWVRDRSHEAIPFITPFDDEPYECCASGSCEVCKR